VSPIRRARRSPPEFRLRAGITPGQRVPTNLPKIRRDAVARWSRSSNESSDESLHGNFGGPEAQRIFRRIVATGTRGRSSRPRAKADWIGRVFGQIGTGARRLLSFPNPVNGVGARLVAAGVVALSVVELATGPAGCSSRSPTASSPCRDPRPLRRARRAADRRRDAGVRVRSLPRLQALRRTHARGRDPEHVCYECADISARTGSAARPRHP
jgi:hypothetical protein